MKGFWLGTVAAVAASMLVPAVAQAADTPSSLYDCQPRDPKAADPPPQPDLPPNAGCRARRSDRERRLQAGLPGGRSAGADEDQSALRRPSCPRETAGPAARLSRVRGGQERHGTRKSASKVSRGEWLVLVLMGLRSPGIQREQRGQRPLGRADERAALHRLLAESLAGAHSLGQLWASNEIGGAGCNSTAEIGWSESAGQFGDVNPHLFIFGFDCGGVARATPTWAAETGCRAARCVFPNSTLTHNDVFHVYGTHMAGNNWWIYYDGQWVGYIPHERLDILFSLGAQADNQAGGEVATPNYWTCTDMGYGGLFGGHPWAAMFSERLVRVRTTTPRAGTRTCTAASSDPSNYATGNWVGGYQFRYGGPGWC